MPLDWSHNTRCYEALEPTMSMRSNKIWSITPTHQQGELSLAKILRKWSLRSPKHASKFALSEKVEIRGWALGLPPTHHMLHIVIQTKDNILSYPLNVPRPDVLKTVLKQESAGQPELMCGFSRWVPAELFVAGVNLGFETEGLIHPAASIRLIGRPETLSM